MFNKLSEIISSVDKSKIVNLLILLFIVVAIPVTVFVAQKQQEIRQRAEQTGQLPDLQSSPKSQFIANEFLVKVKNEAKINDILTKNKVNDFERLTVSSWFKLRIEGETKIIEGTFDQEKKILESEASDAVKLQDLITDLKSDPNIENMQPNYIAKAAFLPNDIYYYTSSSWGQPYEDLWGVRKLQLESVWDKTQGEGITVAVVDTGLDYNHEDISSNVWSNTRESAGNGIDDDLNGYIDDIRGWDFTTCKRTDPVNFNCLEAKEPGPNPIDADGHGTHVSGIIAAVGNNAKGIIGVAPKAKIMPLKGLNDTGFGTTADLSNAIVYATKNGAKVINNSWGCTNCSSNPVAEDAVGFAINSNVIVVFAAGNSNNPISYSSPQNMTNPKPIVVGASDHLDQKSGFSSFGPQLDVLAPGGESENNCSNSLSLSILSLRAKDSNLYRDSGCGQDWINSLILGSSYIRARGTSMAAPFVSGAAALIRAYKPGFSVEDVRLAMNASADDIGNPDFDIYTGSGRVNVNKALLLDLIPKVKITNPLFDESIDPTKTNNVNIFGTASGPNFKQYQIFTKSRYSDKWSPLSFPSTTPVENNILWSGNISDVLPDVYLVRLEVTALNGYKFRYITEVVIEKDIYRLTSNNSSQLKPAISEMKAVWQDYRNSGANFDNSDIYLYDGLTNTERAITNALGNQVKPAISKNLIVWEDSRSGLPDIYLYDLSTNTERPITTAVNSQQKPAISKNLIVWEDWRSGNADVYLFDLSTNNERKITSNSSNQKNPVIDGNLIVWEDYRNGGPQIYVYDLNSNTERQITTNPSAHLYPSISGNKIVWEDWRLGSSPVAYFYDLSTNTERRVSANSIYQFAPKISGNKIVWVDGRHSYSDIYIFDILANKELPVAINPFTKETPAIDGEKIVWADKRNGNYDIYVYSPLPTLTPTPLPTQVPTQIPTPANGISFENFSPDNVIVNNPVKFSGTVVDNFNTIGYRYIYIYVDGVVKYTTYYAHLTTSTTRIPFSYKSVENLSSGTHGWHVKIKDPFNNLLGESLKYNFTIGSISTPSPTQIVSTSTPTPIQSSPIPSNPTDTPSFGTTKLNLALILQAVGTNPSHNVGSKTFTIEIYNLNNQLIKTLKFPMQFIKSAGFKGLVDVGGLASGTYTAKFKTGGYLKISKTIFSGITNAVSLTLLSGDINGDNVVNSNDYYGFSGYSYLFCNNKTDFGCLDNADLNMNGKVNTTDYSFWVANYGKKGS